MKTGMAAALFTASMMLFSGCTKNTTNVITKEPPEFVLVSTVPGGGYLASSGQYLFVYGMEGLHRSADNGVTWTKVWDSVVYKLVCSGSIVIFTTGSEEVFRSSDNGTSWSSFSTGLPSGAGIQTISLSGNKLALGLYSGGVPQIFINTINGTSWTRMEYQGVDFIRDISMSGTAILVGEEYVLYRSPDNGVSWTIDSNYSFQSFVEYNGTVFALGNGIYRSSNNGATWNRVFATPGIYSLLAKGNNLFAAHMLGILRSSDNGITWTKMNVTGISLAATSDFLFVYDGARGWLWRLPLADL